LTQQQQQQLINQNPEPIHLNDFLTEGQDYLESEMLTSLPSMINTTTTTTPTPIQQQQHQQQQQYYVNTESSRILNSSPSASPPPFQPSAVVRQQPNIEQLIQQQQQFNFNGPLSRTQSPITTSTTNILNNPNTNNNNSANLVQINGAFPPVQPSSSSFQSSQPLQQQQQHQQTIQHISNEKLGESHMNVDANNTIPVEKRHAIKIQFNLKCIEKLNNYQLSLNIVFDDNTTRFLESQININKDNPYTLSQDLIDCGLVSEIDKTKLCEALTEAINTRNDETPNSYFLSK